MLSYLTSFWSAETTEPTTVQPQAQTLVVDDDPPTTTYRADPDNTKTETTSRHCWLLRGSEDQQVHSAKCCQPINGLMGVFDSLEDAQTAAAWLALFSGCVHLRLGKVPANRLTFGKPLEVLSLRELRFGPEPSLFQAIFVQSSPAKPTVASPPLELASLEAWLKLNEALQGSKAKRRLDELRQAIADKCWNLWSCGANDALLYPRKLKSE